MFIATKDRKSDKDLYNNEAYKFIPIACHYDNNTLLTKNGELIQIIQINGINAEDISKNLHGLREIVRLAIKDSVNDNNYAFWIHTVRRKTNLDDMTQYNKLLPANIHNLWQKKNFWRDKFVNTLYISIVYAGSSINVNTLNTFINSLSEFIVSKFQERYLISAASKLNLTTNDILDKLKEYGATKLSIRFEGENSYSDLLFLYRRIIHLNEENTLVPIVDLSHALSSHKYAIGSDKIEVINNDGKKFASIISIKEYQEISADAIDEFLRLPIEMITTEVFYFVDKKEVVSSFKYQSDILKVSGDEDLSKINGIYNIMDASLENKFCKQQISISIIADNLEALEKSVRQASLELSEIGIVHVREDINLEQTFWAQLPGNFSFLRRMKYTILNYTASLASLHNFPAGQHESVWGKAVTILRTEKSTPYFMNFHTEDGSNNCIFGGHNSGKTVLTNFLLSESMKYSPKILYFANNNHSQIFIEAIEGQWIVINHGMVNPLLVDDNQEMNDYIREFLKIICNHYVNPINEQGLNFLDVLVKKLFELEYNTRNLTNLIANVDFALDGGDVIKQRLSFFDKDGIFNGVFDSNNPIDIKNNQILGINLQYFTKEYFTDKNIPDDRKLLDKFYENLSVNNSICASLYFVYNYFFTKNYSSVEDKKILAIDNLDSIISDNYLDNILNNSFNNIYKNNGVVLSNINMHLILQNNNLDKYINFCNNVNNKFILPIEGRVDAISEILKLSKNEIEKLKTFNNTMHMFLIKCTDHVIVAEVSIGAYAGILKILSASDSDLSIYKSIIEENPGHPDNWLIKLYNELNSMSNN